MVCALLSAGALDYAACTYGASRLLFRGPKRDTAGTFVAILGGSECYGRCVEHPFPDLIEKDLWLPVVNFGVQNAGPDVFLNDPLPLSLAAQAAVVVVQLLGAQNISNRFYTVHPRRNDRFLAASPMLRALYPGLDFTEFHFTRHLLHTLQHTGPRRFEIVAKGLQEDWLSHMRGLLSQLNDRALLLWIADGMPPQADTELDLFVNPALVTAQMIAALGPYTRRVIHAICTPESRAMGMDGMVFDPTELPMAANLPGPYVHHDIANAVLPHIEDVLSWGWSRQVQN